MTSNAPVLVAGATGFVGRRLVAALIASGRHVRVLARDPRRAADLAGERVEILAGDMLDRDAVGRAVESSSAVFVCVHTLSPQQANDGTSDFVDIEEAGLTNIVDACRAHDVRRVLYLTSIGVAPDGGSTWLRGRWRTERLLLDSGLEATVLRPGMIVGRGGDGFGMVERGARRRVAVVLPTREQRFRTIAVDDLAGELVELLDDARSHGQVYDVGSDDVLTVDQMIDLAAEYLGRPHPIKIHLPRSLIARLAPVIERAPHLPRGAIGGLVGDGSSADMVGDPLPIRTLLSHPPRPYRVAMADALG